jgi:uncharacterized surface protein with fasciclin (FAS1) repeats
MAAGAVLAVAMFAAGCSSDDSGSGGGSAAPAAQPTPQATAAMDQPFGAACSAVPASGAGSFSGMATAPVATAASSNPVLSDLVGAVKSAGLVDTLNSADGITVFAPANDAFKAVPKPTMDAAMKDPKGLLTKVLTGHVVKGKLAPDMLAGDHQSLAGTTITVAGSGEDFTVDGNAKVICGNVQTANATVYIIDQVLLPKS